MVTFFKALDNRIMKNVDEQVIKAERLFSIASLISVTGVIFVTVVFPIIMHKIVNVDNELAEFMIDYTNMSNLMWHDLMQQLEQFPDHLSLRRKRQDYDGEDGDVEASTIFATSQATITDESVEDYETVMTRGISTTISTNPSTGDDEILESLVMPYGETMEEPRIGETQHKLKMKRTEKRKKEKIQESKCPPGPPGPPGIPGSRGEDGLDGLPGKKGKSGKWSLGNSCKPCNPGLPGKPGYKGVRGPRGIRGPKGAPGNSGQYGADGEEGPEGDKGSPGIPGIPGKQGRNGTDGVNFGRGVPGPKGRKGPAGLVGDEGAPGENGEEGLPGRRGERGPSGKQGTTGTNGDNGARGVQGPNGDAAGFCSCPNPRKITHTDILKVSGNENENSQEDDNYGMAEIQYEVKGSKNKEKPNGYSTASAGGDNENEQEGYLLENEDEKEETFGTDRFSSDYSKDIPESVRDMRTNFDHDKILQSTKRKDQLQKRKLAKTMMMKSRKEGNSSEIDVKDIGQKKGQMNETMKMKEIIMKKGNSMKVNVTEAFGADRKSNIPKILLDGGKQPEQRQGENSVRKNRLQKVTSRQNRKNKMKFDHEEEMQLRDKNSIILDDAAEVERLKKLLEEKENKLRNKGVEKSAIPRNEVPREKSKKKKRKKHRKISSQRNGTTGTSNVRSQSSTAPSNLISNEKVKQEDVGGYSIKISYRLPQQSKTGNLTSSEINS